MTIIIILPKSITQNQSENDEIIGKEQQYYHISTSSKEIYMLRKITKIKLPDTRIQTRNNCMQQIHRLSMEKAIHKKILSW